ncbi:transcriptional regulator, XRE family domain protein [Burkholderia pseudomallei]|nr:transcriptional regulator, XRE family domain protein [Burkholderia pseudomallei]
MRGSVASPPCGPPVRSPPGGPTFARGRVRRKPAGHCGGCGVGVIPSPARRDGVCCVEPGDAATGRQGKGRVVRAADARGKPGRRWVAEWHDAVRQRILYDSARNIRRPSPRTVRLALQGMRRGRIRSAKRAAARRRRRRAGASGTRAYAARNSSHAQETASEPSAGRSPDGRRTQRVYERGDATLAAAVVNLLKRADRQPKRLKVWVDAPAVEVRLNR